MFLLIYSSHSENAFWFDRICQISGILLTRVPVRSSAVKFVSSPTISGTHFRSMFVSISSANLWDLAFLIASDTLEEYCVAPSSLSSWSNCEPDITQTVNEIHRCIYRSKIDRLERQLTYKYIQVYNPNVIRKTSCDGQAKHYRSKRILGDPLLYSRSYEAMTSTLMWKGKRWDTANIYMSKSMGTWHIQLINVNVLQTSEVGGDLRSSATLIN